MRSKTQRVVRDIVMTRTARFVPRDTGRRSIYSLSMLLVLHRIEAHYDTPYNPTSVYAKPVLMPQTALMADSSQLTRIHCNVYYGAAFETFNKFYRIKLMLCKLYHVACTSQESNSAGTSIYNIEG